MPARGYRKGEDSRSVRAALMYMSGGVSYRLCGERYGITGTAVHQALIRLRRDQLNAWPEDEVTC